MIICLLAIFVFAANLATATVYPVDATVALSEKCYYRNTWNVVTKRFVYKDNDKNVFVKKFLNETNIGERHRGKYDIGSTTADVITDRQVYDALFSLEKLEPEGFDLVRGEIYEDGQKGNLVVIRTFERVRSLLNERHSDSFWLKDYDEWKKLKPEDQAILAGMEEIDERFDEFFDPKHNSCVAESDPPKPDGNCRGYPKRSWGNFPQFKFRAGRWEAGEIDRRYFLAVILRLEYKPEKLEYKPEKSSSMDLPDTRQQSFRKGKTAKNRRQLKRKYSYKKKTSRG